MRTSLPLPAARDILLVTGSACPAVEPSLSGNCMAAEPAEEADWMPAAETNDRQNG